jgi:hypothetical protein
MKPVHPRDDNPYDEAIVVFSGRTDLPLLKLLRPGFRHCFAVVQSTDTCLLVEPLAHRLEITAHPQLTIKDLTDAYRRLGLRVVHVHPEPVFRRPAHCRPFSCVELVKRLLGLRLPFVVTPWQLYRQLNLN